MGLGRQQVRKKKKVNESILNELTTAGYDCAIALATEAEIEAGAACGQLAIILE